MRHAVFVAILLVTEPTLADWQYTKWGMTVDQLEAAARSAGVDLNKSTSAEDLRKGFRFVGTYSTDKYNFDAQFLVDGRDKLDRIQLALRPASQCVYLKQDLEATYGKPFEQDKDSLVWLDRRSNNRVTWINAGGFVCMVQYQPIATRGSKGL